MSVAFWVLVAIMVGFVGFWLLALTLIVQVFRSLLGAFRRRRVRGSSRRMVGGVVPQVCPHQGCGHLNPRPGLYCSRCGRNLRERREIDAYG